jgi:lysophospholipase L1-like esterase
MLKSFLIIFLCGTFTLVAKPQFFSADNPLIQYTGRIDFSNAKLPRFWTAGVYIQAKFRGSGCEVVINDEMQWGKFHNYIVVVIDKNKPAKFKLTGRSNVIKVAEGLSKGEHTITICKNTEAIIGYLEFVGFNCEALLELPKSEAHKIEFIGDSITSGMGVDLEIPCGGNSEWYDQHSAWFAYGPRTARSLNAQWHLTSESGIGLIHSCCNKEKLMPQIYDKVNLSKDSLVWDFKKYQPDVVTVCLGQNDGIQDSLQFTTAYVGFVTRLREYYPSAEIVCLTSPMGNDKLRKVLKNYLSGVVDHMRSMGERKIDMYAFSRGFNNGCGGHPDMKDQEMIANELTTFLRNKMKWK